MSLYDRAAQFSPFAALTGHSTAIAETGRLTDQRAELDECEIARVDAELQRLQELLPGRPTASITYSLCQTNGRTAAATKLSPDRSSGSTRSTA